MLVLLVYERFWFDISTIFLIYFPIYFLVGLPDFLLRARRYEKSHSPGEAIFGGFLKIFFENRKGFFNNLDWDSTVWDIGRSIQGVMAISIR